MAARGASELPARAFAWTLRRLRFSRSAAPKRRCCLIFSARFPRTSMDARLRPEGTRRKPCAEWSSQGACLRHVGPCGKDRSARAPFPIGRFSHPAWRCRSSVVEHPLGKGEVVSSILTGSTRKSPINKGFSDTRGKRARRIRAEQSTTRRAKTHQISTKCSADVHAGRVS